MLIMYIYTSIYSAYLSVPGPVGEVAHHLSVSSVTAILYVNTYRARTKKQKKSF